MDTRQLKNWVLSTPPVAEAFDLSDASFPEREAPRLYKQRGSSDPLQHFPIAILSKSLEAVRSLARDSNSQGLDRIEPCAATRALSVVASILDLSRTYWGMTSVAPIRLLTLRNANDNSSTIALKCPNDMVLTLSDPSCDENAYPIEFCLDPLERHPACVSSDISELKSPFLNELLEMIHGAMERRLIHGDPALVFPGFDSDRLPLRNVAMLILSIVRNSPYHPDMSLGNEDKGRFQVINALNSPETDEGIDFLKEKIERRPRLLMMPGWCGGLMFHKAAQLGHNKLLETLIRLTEKSEIQSVLNRPLSEIIILRDGDGSSPYHVARRYGKAESADIISSCGGGGRTTNFYGYRPPR